jgi:hypothetical protein
VRAAVGWVQGAPYFILPEEDVGGFRQVLVKEDSRGRVPWRRDTPQVLEVEPKLCNELRLILGGGRCCQEFACNPQRFSVDELGQGRLQVLFECCAHADEDEGESFGPTLPVLGILWRP